MIVRILGSAAGGGFPQWNCNCPNCRLQRSRPEQIPARTQSSVALSLDGSSWHLLNASPDLRTQLMKHPDMVPCAQDPVRKSKIKSVLLSNADMDHTLGLLLLRESGEPFRILSSSTVRKALQDDNSLFQMLTLTPGMVDWSTLVEGERYQLDSGIHFTVIDVRLGPPLYAMNAKSAGQAGGAVRHSFPADGADWSLGFVFELADRIRFGYFPSVGKISAELLSVWKTCDLLFVDGTFWDNEELIRIKGGTRTAEAMGHLPLQNFKDGQEGLLARTKHLNPRYGKYLVHINNTNPILLAESAERQEVLRAGWKLGEDSLEFRI